MAIEIQWRPETAKVSDLKLWEQNPRKIGKKEYERLKNRIQKRGFHDVIKVNTDMTILSGNQRRRALEELGVDTVTILKPERALTGEEMQSVALESNLGDGNWDWDELANFDPELLRDVGFEDKDLAKYFQLDVTEDEAPEPRPDPNVKLGDLFQLGNHRLLCGDATKKEDVERLMDGQKADITFHSPPYNVGHNLGYKKDSKYANSDDDLSDDQYRALLVDTTALSMTYSSYAFVNLQFLANNKKVLIDLLTTYRDNFVDIAFWNKSQVQPAMADNVMNSQTEVIFIFCHDNNSRAISTGSFRGTVSNFIETNSASATNKHADIHNATYPIALPAHFINTFTSSGHGVLDLFGGSGSTLIACEQLNRKCYMMEIDPHYTRVIIDRWEKLTGRKAILSEK